MGVGNANKCRRAGVGMKDHLYKATFSRSYQEVVTFFSLTGPVLTLFLMFNGLKVVVSRFVINLVDVEL